MRGTAAQVEQGRIKLRALRLQLSHDAETLEMQLSHQRDMFAMKADLMRDLIKALIEHRVDAVCKACEETLKMYAEQSRHYMAQQDRYADAEIKATEPLERANLRVRLNETDLQLTNIRSDGGTLQREMARVILLLGGTMPTLSNDDQRALLG